MLVARLQLFVNEEKVAVAEVVEQARPVSLVVDGAFQEVAIMAVYQSRVSNRSPGGSLIILKGI